MYEMFCVLISGLTFAWVLSADPGIAWLLSRLHSRNYRWVPIWVRVAQQQRSVHPGPVVLGGSATLTSLLPSPFPHQAPPSLVTSAAASLLAVAAPLWPPRTQPKPINRCAMTHWVFLAPRPSSPVSYLAGIRPATPCSFPNPAKDPIARIAIFSRVLSAKFQLSFLFLFQWTLKNLRKL